MKKFWPILVIVILLVAANALGSVNLNESGVLYLKQGGYGADQEANDDVWSPDTAYTFIAAASALSISSASANDAAAGTGCRTLTIEGLDASYNSLSETVSMNGTNTVTSSGSFLRVNRVFCATVGSGAVNAGLITIAAGATTIATVPASAGKSQMAIYTAPADLTSYLPAWNASVNKDSVGVDLQMRPYGGSWQTLEHATVHTGALFYKPSENWLLIPKKADVRLRTTHSHGADIRVDATMEILQKR